MDGCQTSEEGIPSPTCIIHAPEIHTDKSEADILEAQPKSSVSQVGNHLAEVAVQVASPTSSINKDANEDGPESSALPTGNSEESTKFTLYQKMTFVSITIATMADVAAFSIMTPFFPIEAESRGLSSVTVGFTFSIFSLASFVFSPIFGKILPVVGARFMFLAGSFVSAGCCILFGFIDEMPTQTTFTVFCMVLRVVTGIGASASMTASAAIIAYAFPNNVGLASSVNEMVAGVGSMIGPAIGGLLYSAGGFKLPFIVLGAVDLCFIPINYFLMPEHGTKNEKMGSLFQLLRIPAIWVTMTCVLQGSIAMGFLDPTLSPHLKELKLNIDEIGFVFLGFSALYAISAVIFGYLADKTKATRIIMVLGSYGGCISFLLLGPSPYLNLPFTTPIVLSSLVIGCSTIAMIVMPSFLDMLNSAKWYGIPNDLGLNGMISGLWTGVFSLGSMLGPIIGGSLKQGFGFGKATTLLAGSCIFTMLVLCFFGVWEYRCGKGKRIPSSRRISLHSSTDEERSPLLDGINT
ncbi:MFS-type transporter SLC18B1-like isoform X2 [Acanthaster planci]|nr:MFS-type transporter SLC18B1-like isoform X2 [Acanthaster planci]XP_022102772.1 MFS-type transporter SLC18B1-like isoform X2 [Acanthaster planci]XP_022102773.1 MFS-type transporter SLC18B1-like isoform X2 [Acanthaster planci]